MPKRELRKPFCFLNFYEWGQPVLNRVALLQAKAFFGRGRLPVSSSLGDQSVMRRIRHDHRLAKGVCVLPLARARPTADGTLHLHNRPELAPGQASDSWWAAVLEDPRTRSPKLAANEDLRLTDVKAARPLIISCWSCEMVTQYPTNELIASLGDNHRLCHLDTALRFCPRSLIGRNCHARWRQD